MKHIVLDLETLGKKPGCVVWAIGAVCFESEYPWAPVAEFYQLIDIFDSAVGGFTVDPETKEWWNQQSGDSKKELDKAYDPGWSSYPTVVLRHFADWVEGLRGEESVQLYVWGNSAAFDNEILKAYYEKLSLPVPWTYREDMCFRTIKNIYPDCKPEIDNGLPHHALYDARYQALWLQRICNKYHLFGAP
jgi:hypothetical protein